MGLWPGSNLKCTPCRDLEKLIEKVKASLDKTCPTCEGTITPDQVKRLDFERIECPSVEGDSRLMKQTLGNHFS